MNHPNTFDTLLLFDNSNNTSLLPLLLQQEPYLEEEFHDDNNNNNNNDIRNDDDDENDLHTNHEDDSNRNCSQDNSPNSPLHINSSAVLPVGTISPYLQKSIYTTTSTTADETKATTTTTTTTTTESSLLPERTVLLPYIVPQQQYNSNNFNYMKTLTTTTLTTTSESESELVDVTVTDLFRYDPFVQQQRRQQQQQQQRRRQQQQQKRKERLSFNDDHYERRNATIIDDYSYWRSNHKDYSNDCIISTFDTTTTATTAAATAEVDFVERTTYEMYEIVQYWLNKHNNQEDLFVLREKDDDDDECDFKVTNSLNDYHHNVVDDPKSNCSVQTQLSYMSTGGIHQQQKHSLINDDNQNWNNNNNNNNNNNGSWHGYSGCTIMDNTYNNTLWSLFDDEEEGDDDYRYIDRIPQHHYDDCIEQFFQQIEDSTTSTSCRHRRHDNTDHGYDLDENTTIHNLSSTLYDINKLSYVIFDGCNDNGKNNDTIPNTDAVYDSVQQQLQQQQQQHEVGTANIELSNKQQHQKKKKYHPYILLPKSQESRTTTQCTTCTSFWIWIQTESASKLIQRLLHILIVVPFILCTICLALDSYQSVISPILINWIHHDNICTTSPIPTSSYYNPLSCITKNERYLLQCRRT